MYLLKKLIYYLIVYSYFLLNSFYNHHYNSIIKHHLTQMFHNNRFPNPIIFSIILSRNNLVIIKLIVFRYFYPLIHILFLKIFFSHYIKSY
jgi:hypothetical protein